MSEDITWPPIGGAPYTVPDAGEEGWPELTNYLVALSGAQSTGAQRIAARVATTSPVTIGSASDCLVTVKLTVPGMSTVNLPAGLVGQYFMIGDGTGDASANNITIMPNGTDKIAGNASYILTQDGASVILCFVGAGTWSIVAQAAGEGGGGGVSRSALDAGLPGYVVINNDTTGLMAQEQYLASKRGGLGANASAFTGLVRATAGVFSASPIVNADLPSGIDPLKIGTGVVDSAEFAYLDGVTSPIQTQLNAKQTGNAAIIPGTAAKITYDAKGLVTAGAALVAGDIPSAIPAIKIGGGQVDDTEFGRLDGITGNIQTLLDTKAAGPNVAVDSQFVLFDGTSGKLLKAAAATGIAYSTSGVYSVKTFDQILPTQTGNATKALVTDGTTATWQTVASAGGLATRYTAANTTVANSEALLVDSTAAARTITTPAGVAGYQFMIIDDKGTSFTNNITVNPPAGTGFRGLAVNAPITINVNGGWVWFFWDGTVYTYILAGTGSSGMTPAYMSADVSPAVPSTEYLVDLSGGTRQITFPSGTTPFVIGATYQAGTVSDTSFLRVIPPTGQQIDNYPVNDALVLRYANFQAVWYRAAGSTRIVGAYQTISIPQGGQIPGSPNGIVQPLSIGETVESLFNTVSAGTGLTQLAQVILTGGKYRLRLAGSGSKGTSTQLFLTIAPTVTIDTTTPGKTFQDSPLNAPGTTYIFNFDRTIVVPAAGQTYYATSQAVTSTTSLSGMLEATRIG